MKLQKQKRDNEHLKALQKIITLEKLCRAMQEERALLHERLDLLTAPADEPQEEEEAKELKENTETNESEKQELDVNENNE